jgi:two-component system, sensor histidine kinase and response regulator
MATILLIEQSEQERSETFQTLESAGHRVLQVGSAEQGLALIAERSVDVVVLDLTAEQGNNLTLIDRMYHSGQSRTPLLLCTDTPDALTRAELLRLGAQCVLTRPFDPRELNHYVGLLSGAASKRTEPEVAEELGALRQFRDDVADLLMNDLKIPLDIILTNLKYLARELEDGPPMLAEALSDTIDASSELSRIFNNLLDVRLAEEGNMPLFKTQASIDYLYEEVLKGRAREAELMGLSLEAEPTGLTLQADPWVLRRVIENIIDNSMRVTPRGGRVVMRGARAGEHARLQVGNTGPAIPLALRGRLFDKMTQADVSHSSPRRNLGVGLYFCRLAMRAHRGTIHIEEHEDFPTVFMLELPLS